MRILLFISVVILSSCKNDNKLTFFNGKILNKTSYLILFHLLFLFAIFCNKRKCIDGSSFTGGMHINPIISSVDENPLYNSLINESGNFSISIDSLESGLYNFFLQPEFQYVILEEGDSIYIRLNSLDFDESLVFMGKGSAKNNFLIDVFGFHPRSFLAFE